MRCADGAPHLVAGDSARFMNAVALRVNPPRSGTGDKAEAVINFSGVGQKHLALAWAPLKKL